MKAVINLDNPESRAIVDRVKASVGLERDEKERLPIPETEVDHFLNELFWDAYRGEESEAKPIMKAVVRRKAHVRKVKGKVARVRNKSGSSRPWRCRRTGSWSRAWKTPSSMCRATNSSSGPEAMVVAIKGRSPRCKASRTAGLS